MNKKDGLLIALALLVALALYGLSQWRLGGEAAQVVVTIDGEEVLRKRISETGRYEIAQDDGARNVIVIEDGAVYMQEANCRDGLCMQQGKVKNAAKNIVCLPHKLVVQMQGESTQQSQPEDDLDVIVQ